MNQELLDKICAFANGSCKTEADIADAFDLSYEEVLECVVAAEIDWCSQCGWICETFEFIEDEGELVCIDCAEDKND